MTLRARLWFVVLLLVPVGLATVALIELDSQAAAAANAAVGSLDSPHLLDELPQDWIDDLLRVEDPSFYDHRGVDLRTPGQGWTTITQGIVKRCFSGPLTGVVGKTRQSLLALSIDRHLTKEQQLRVFLEVAYFGAHEGRELVGFESAAVALYGKPLLGLTRAEYLGLVAMLVAPNRYHPVERPEEHRERVARIEAMLSGRCEYLSWKDVDLEGCRNRDGSSPHAEAPMIQAVAVGIVVLTGIYLCALAALSLAAPSRAQRFLLGFANSRRVHYIELFARFVVGAAFVIHAPNMLFHGAFKLFGLVLLVTTVCLFFLPWQWHQRFAQQAVPRAARYIALIGLCSLALGGLILVAVLRGNAA